MTDANRTLSWRRIQISVRLISRKKRHTRKSVKNGRKKKEKRRKREERGEEERGKGKSAKT